MFIVQDSVSVYNLNFFSEPFLNLFRGNKLINFGVFAFFALQTY